VRRRHARRCRPAEVEDPITHEGIASEPGRSHVWRPAAEAREQRAGTEGKAGQHGTHRALNRVRVSQALERLRQAARQRKKDRFTALLHHVNLDSLREAFYALKRDAAPECRWHEVARIRGRSRAQARRPARPVFTAARIARSPRAGPIYRRRMGGSGRWQIAALEDKIV